MLRLTGFCKHAVWLFGVLVALAIEAAITRVVPHLLDFQIEPDRMQAGAEALRLLVFGLVTIRFYLAAAHLFDDIHACALEPDEEPDENNEVSELEFKRLLIQGRQFGTDFFAALVHFSFISAWSLTLEVHPASTSGHVVSQWAYRAIVLVILVYNAVWLVSRRPPYPKELQVWAIANTLTAALAALVFAALAWWPLHWDPLRAEIPALGIIGVASLLAITQATIGVGTYSKMMTVALNWIAERIGKTARILDHDNAEGLIKARKEKKDDAPKDPPVSS